MNRKLLGVGALLAAAIAHAYILPGGSILRRMTEARDELQLSTLKVEGTLSFFGSSAQAAGTALGLPADRPELMVDGTVALKLPGRCRLEASSAESGKRVAAAESNGKRRAEGGELAALNLALAQICPLLGSRSSSDGESRVSIEKHLAYLKIDPRKTSLGRFGGQVAYVLGDAAEGQPQMWIYKDTFLPARLRFLVVQGVKWDVRLLDYTSPAAGEWFPRVIEVVSGNEAVLKFTALKADNKGRLDDKLF